MSDCSNESCDDSDLDPDFEVKSNESESNESEVESGNVSLVENSRVKRDSASRKSKGRPVSTSAIVENSRVKRDSESCKSKGRPVSPSAIDSLDLSESDSDASVEDEKQTPSLAEANPENKSAYFLEVDDSKCENTDYDFSHILALQNRVSKAREQYERDTKIAKDTPSEPKKLDVSISELLAIGETNVSEGDSSENSINSETEPVEPEKKVIQITLENEANKQSNKLKKRTSIFEKQMQLIQKENQLLMHKVHLLCLIAHGNYVNSFLVNSENIYGYLLSLLPEEYAPPLNLTSSYVKRLLNWFGRKFGISKDIPRTGEISAEHLESIFSEQKKFSLKDLVVLFVSLLRGLGLTTRFVVSLQPVPLRPKKVPQQPTKPVKENKSKKQKKAAKGKKKTGSGFQVLPSTSKSNSSSKPKTRSPRRSPSIILAEKMAARKAEMDKKAVRKIIRKQARSNNMKVLSSDSEESGDEKEVVKSGIDYWVEVYIEREETWISVDIYSLKVDCSHQIYARCTQPVAYVIAWRNDNTLKDVTRRYVPGWHMVSKKNRVDQDWFNESISAFCGLESIFDKLEEQKLDHNESQMKATIPTKISDLKNHPLYALKRHLLKFEAIYPPDAVPLGYIRGEEVYSRFCVHELFSREKWIRQGKCVKVNEKAYKIVKSRTKSDRFSGTEKPLELYGHWQVDDYIPPLVIDNKIPRNEYGNIEVYKPSMLPIGTVHLRVPGIPKIAKKMDIDCAPAVIGWEHHGGRSHPVIEGVVVCKEYQDILMDAWCAENEASSQRSDHKRRQNSFKKWMKLVKHELIKIHLKRKYNFGDPKKDDGADPPKKEKTISS